MEKFELANIVKITSGFAFKSDLFNSEKNGVPLIRIRDVVRGFSDTFYTGAYKDEYVIKDGDALIGMDGEFNLAKWKGGKALLNQRVCKIESISEKLDQNYLLRFLPSALKDIEDITPFVTVKHLSVKSINSIRIPLPPLSEQKRIADILDKADELRQKRQQSIAKLDELLQATFIDMFGDPVTNPKGWEVEKLKQNIIHSNNGLSRRRKETENVGEIVLRLQDVHYDGIHYEKDLNRISLDDSEKQRFKVDSGDILFIRVNGNPEYVGRSAVFSGFNEDIYHNDHLIRIKVSEEYNPYFLSYSFNSSSGKKIISKYVKTSAGQHTISQGGIESMDFIIPPRDLQDIFEHKAKKIQIHKNLLTQQLNKQNQLFQSLQHQAFNGTL